MYQNESHDNQGGQWLIKKAEFNVGSNINTFLRLKCKVNDPYLDKRSILADKRQVTYCCNELFYFKIILIICFNLTLFLLLSNTGWFSRICYTYK